VRCPTLGGPAGLVLAVGGITHPLYLLRMQMGYTILTAAAPVRNVELWTITIIFGTIILAWITWRFVERSAHRWTKGKMSAFATSSGWSSRLQTPAGGRKSPTAAEL
jgi:peptidoglycan/LPS O-acetylase OafA/YrhL